MIGAAAGFLARLLAGLAGCALLTAVALVVLAGYVATWPLRRSPANERRARLTLTATVAVVALAQELRRSQSAAPPE